MDIKDIISNNSADGILSDNRILNILNDLGYFKEYANHRLILRSLMEKDLLYKLIDVSTSKTHKALIFHEFVSNTGFDIELTASIFSSISGIAYSNFDDRIKWSPSLSKEDMEKYILQHLHFFFDNRINVKNVASFIRSINRFGIEFEFQKSSWDFDYEKENAHYIKLGELNKCKSNEVELIVCTRSGNDIETATGVHDTTKVDFEWDEPFEAVENEYETSWYNPDLLTLSIEISHPIYDISWIRVKHPC